MAGAKFEGKWVFDRSEGMEDLVAALNLPADKLPKSGQTSLEYKITGPKSFSIHGTHPKSGKDLTTSFTVGERFKAEEIGSYLGKEIYATPTWDGSRLVVAGEGGQASITREIVGDELHTTISAGGKSGKRIFRRA